MSVTAVKIASGQAAAVGANVVATVPVGHVWELKFASVWNSGSPGIEVAVGIRSGGVDIYLQDTNPLGPGVSAVRYYDAVMEAGDELLIFLGAAGNVRYWLSGLDRS